MRRRALLMLCCAACGALGACTSPQPGKMAFSCWPDQHVAPNVSFPARRDAGGYYVCN
jgi:hypothetical protein